MLFGLLSAAVSAATSRGGQIDGRQPRRRRTPRDPNAPPEPANPDFDFGPLPSPLDLAAPTAAERFKSRLLLLLVFLTLLPIAGLLLALFFNF
jgi:hypothetical protein